MRRNGVLAFLLTAGMLAGLTACGKFEPEIARGDIVTGNAVSGSAVSGNAVRGGVKVKSRGKEEKQKSLTGSQYRNQNSNKRYYFDSNDSGDDLWLVQTNLDGSAKKRLNIKGKEDEVRIELLWVTDETIYLFMNKGIFRIPIRHNANKGEVLDTESKECLSSDVALNDDEEEVRFCVMDENAIYYLSKKEKLVEIDLKSGKKREAPIAKDISSDLFVYGAIVLEDKLLVGDPDCIYCIQRNTLKIENITGSLTGDVFDYMESTGDMYFLTGDGESIMKYDGKTTQSVASYEEICRAFSRYDKDLVEEELYLDSLHVYGDKVYIEYMIDDDDYDCGMLVYDRNAKEKLYLEEEFNMQGKKYSGKERFFYNFGGEEGEYIYLIIGEKEAYYSYSSYNWKTKELKKVSETEYYRAEQDYPYKKAYFWEPQIG